MTAQLGTIDSQLGGIQLGSIDNDFIEIIVDELVLDQDIDVEVINYNEPLAVVNNRFGQINSNNCRRNCHYGRNPLFD